MDRRYIEANALIQPMEDACMGVMSGCVPFNEPLKVLESAPTADVRENVKAHWSYTDDLYETPCCSNCNWESLDYIEFNFCPNCGAEMERRE